MTLRDRFESKVDRSGGTDACHLWTASTARGGYGTIQGHRKSDGMKVATRVAWELYVGKIPKGKCVLHNCPTGDNPRCVNIRHLWLGSKRDNSRDAAKKGRTSGGRKSKSGALVSRLQEVRDRLRHGETPVRIARDLGVHPNAIRQFRQGITYQ